jgi:hypothetical protein
MTHQQATSNIPNRRFGCALVLTCAVLTGGSAAADPAAPAHEMPGGSIFGFTSPADTAAPGDKELGFELTSALGRRGGGYQAHGLKIELNAGVTENFALSISTFAAAHRIRNTQGMDDRSRVAFDGFSTELFYRFIERSATNPLAMTLAVEPRFARVDDAGGGETSLGVEFKLFADAVILPGRLFGAANLVFETGASRTGDPLGPRWERGSGLSLSAALTTQASERIFLGVEARATASFAGAFLDRMEGRALFAGPTAMVRLSETSALNVAWTPQIAGRAAGARSSRDLDNFTRHEVRVKYALAF